jgi:hypothetical protein
MSKRLTIILGSLVIVNYRRLLCLAKELERGKNSESQICQSILQSINFKRHKYLIKTSIENSMRSLFSKTS